MVSVFIRDKGDRPRRCFLCVGKAHALPPEDSFVQELIREFYTPGDFYCPVCLMTLEDKMHLQRHALEIHGTVS
ncbi:hypothetical protein F5Y16DRAFT_239439 [Xylariaceae sp. FL0255]|nr:hypothetical protein F5Y16DRAFT_239439 [Xylariaceae sp. FL0255]